VTRRIVLCLRLGTSPRGDKGKVDVVETSLALPLVASELTSVKAGPVIVTTSGSWMVGTFPTIEMFDEVRRLDLPLSGPVNKARQSASAESVDATKSGLPARREKGSSASKFAPLLGGARPAKATPSKP
jgi:hypothetical protein